MGFFVQPQQRATPRVADATILLGSPFSAMRYAMAVSTVLGVVSLLLLSLTFY